MAWGGGASHPPLPRLEPPGTVGLTKPAPTKDYGDNDAPGALSLCLHSGPAGPCVSGPVSLPLQRATPDGSPAWEPHYLLAAKMVHPRGVQAAPLLLIVTGSLNSGDGDQIGAPLSERHSLQRRQHAGGYRLRNTQHREAPRPLEGGAADPDRPRRPRQALRSTSAAAHRALVRWTEALTTPLWTVHPLPWPGHLA